MTRQGQKSNRRPKPKIAWPAAALLPPGVMSLPAMPPQEARSAEGATGTKEQWAAKA